MRLIELLVEFGADVNAARADGRTALHERTAGGSRNLSVVKALLSAGANPNVKDAKGRTALHLATRIGDVELGEALIAAGVDPNIRNAEDASAFDVASAGNKHEMVALLAESGANPNSDPTVLFEAIRWGDADERVKSLLDAGIDANAVMEVCGYGPTKFDLECPQDKRDEMREMHILRFAIESRYWNSSDDEQYIDKALAVALSD